MKSARNTLWITTLLLLAVGVVFVYSASSLSSTTEPNGDQTAIARKHLLFVVAGLTALIGLSATDYRILKKAALPLLVLTVGLLVAVLIPGVSREINQSRRWIRIGSFSFQPSELAKFTLVIFIATLAARRPDRLRDMKRGLLPVGLAVLLLTGLIWAERDRGTPMFIAAVCFLLVAVAGTRLRYLGPFVAVIVLALSTVIGIGLIRDDWSHMPSRVEDYIYRLEHGRAADPTERGYQTSQALLALGSGGLEGKGLGLGRQKILFVPEQHTDFIFSVIGEEKGFLGTGLVILIFMMFTFAGLQVAKLARRDQFASLLAFGITLTIALQAVFNIAVVTSLVPTKGISLPLISKGGSALLFQCCGIGILISIANRFIGLEQETVVAAQTASEE